MSAQDLNDEFCASCGNFVTSLVEETGWCNSCSGVTPCLRCSEPLTNNDTSKICNKCKYIAWLEANADAIDRTMVVDRVSAAKAKKLVLQRNRPMCFSCGGSISGGSQQTATKNRSLFCTKTAKCRKAQNAYRYYKDRKGLKHEEALQRALVSATTFTLLRGLSGKAVHDQKKTT